MIKKRFISMLVLLMTAVTGAWAQTERLLTTITPTGNTTYSETTPGAVTVTQDCEKYNERGWCFEYKPGGSVTVEANEGYTISKCVFILGNSGSNSTTRTISTSPFKINFVLDSYQDACYCEGTDEIWYYDGVKSIQVYTNTVDVTGINLDKTEASMTVGGDALTLTATVAPDNATDQTVTWTTSDASVATVADGVVTAVAAGTATITATATNGTADTGDDVSATCAVTVSPAGYSVSLKSGTEDATSWQGKAGTDDYQELPLTGLEAGTAVSVKYNGTKKVKSVKAVKKAPAGPVTYTELKGGEVLHVGDIINLSEEISFNHGNYYMGSYGSPYTVIRADLTIDEYDETVVNEKADGNYYLIKANDGYYYHFQRALGVTSTSDGILVTYNEKLGKWLDYTFTVHEP